MRIRGFITHKLAEKYEDCQDFFSLNEEKKRLAVSDGMAQSIFPQWWAELLSESYVDGCEPKNIDDVEALRKKWIKKVNQFKCAQEKIGRPTWMLENSLAEKRGAGATLCGIEILNDKEFNSYILGDSCLVFVNKEHRIIELLGSNPDGFNNHPDYFDSIQGGKGNPVIKKRCVFPEEGALLMVTDALAEFIESKRIEGTDVSFIDTLLAIDSNSSFEDIVDNWRTNEKMHNDDTTLVIIENDYTDKWNINMVSLTELIDDEKRISTDVANSGLNNVFAAVQATSKSSKNIKDTSCNCESQEEITTNDSQSIGNKTNQIGEQEDTIEEIISIPISELQTLKKLLKRLCKLIPASKCKKLKKPIDDIFNKYLKI